MTDATKQSKTNAEEATEAEGTAKNRFAVVPLSFCADPTLSHAEFRLIVALMGHDLPDSRNNGKRKAYVSVGRTRLAAIMGVSDPRRISRMLEELEQKEWIRREFRPGQTTLIHLPKTFASESTLGGGDQGSRRPRVKETNPPLVVKTKTPLVAMTNQRKENKMRNKTRSDWPPSEPSPSVEKPVDQPRKKRQGRDDKWPLLTDPEKIREAVNKIDIEPFRAKFPDLDIDSVLCEFREKCTEGIPSKPKVNPWNIRHWTMGFRNFCRKQMEFYADRLQARRLGERDQHHEVPIAAPEEVKAGRERYANAVAWAEIETMKQLQPDKYEELLNKARASLTEDSPDDKTLHRKMVALWRTGVGAEGYI